MTPILPALFLVAQLADAGSYLALSTRISEQNPLAASLAAEGAGYAVVAKVALCALVLAVAAVVGGKRGTGLLVLGAVIGAFGAASNVWAAS